MQIAPLYAVLQIMQSNGKLNIAFSYTCALRDNVAFQNTKLQSNINFIDAQHQYTFRKSGVSIRTHTHQQSIF